MKDWVGGCTGRQVREGQPRLDSGNGSGEMDGVERNLEGENTT